MGQYVHINGSLIPESEASLRLYDHGFLYGDGAFEGIRSYDGRIFKLTEHIERMYCSVRALGFDLKITRDEMARRIIQVVRENGEASCYIRLSVSRGVGLGLDPKHIQHEPTIAISTASLHLYPRSMYEEGLTAVTCSTRVVPAQCIDPRVKSLGRYVNNIMAKMEANRVGAGEGIMLNVEGYVAEATGDNVFIIRNGQVITPPPSAGILAGITRATVMHLASEAGITVREEMMTLYDIYTADEAFLTGTAAEVIPMVHLDGRDIADGRPGPVSRKLIDLFRAHTAETGTPVA